MSARSPSVASSCSSATRSPSMARKSSATVASPAQAAPAAPSMLQMLEYMRAFTASRPPAAAEHTSPEPLSASTSKQGSPSDMHGSSSGSSSAAATTTATTSAAWHSPPPPPPMLSSNARTQSEAGNDRKGDGAAAKRGRPSTSAGKSAKRPRSDSARATADVLPTVAFTPASTRDAADAQAGFNRHLRRFTIDSHARPEDLLAALLQHTRSFAMEPPSHSSKVPESPFSSNAVAPTTSSMSGFAADDETLWLAPPPSSTASSSMDIDGYGAMQHGSAAAHASLPAPWTMVMDATQTPSHTSSVASSTTDISQAAENDADAAKAQAKLSTWSDFLQHPAGHAWLKEMRDNNGDTLPALFGDAGSAPFKSLPIASQPITVDAIPALLRLLSQQASLPPPPPQQQAQQQMQGMHIDNGMVANHFHANNAMTSALLDEHNHHEAGAAETSMGMLDQFIANISASIDHQSTAAAHAAEALQDYPKHVVGLYTDHIDDIDDYDNRPNSAISSVSSEPPSAPYEAQATVKRPTQSPSRPRVRKTPAKAANGAATARVSPSTAKVASSLDHVNDDHDQIAAPAPKKRRRAPKAKVEKTATVAAAASAAEAMESACDAESPPPLSSTAKKPERDQKRLADRRRRRRESHNAVERRRRDLINERIAELATLLPEAMLLEAIANSTGGGTAPHIDLAPFTRKGIAEAQARARAEAAAAAAEANDDDNDDSDAEHKYDPMLAAPDDEEAREAALLQAIAQSKPNKGIILTKSVDYIKQLHEVCSAMRAKNVELQQQLESVRRAVFGGAAAKGPRDEQDDTDDTQSTGSISSPKDAFRRAPDRFPPSFDTNGLRGPAFGATLTMNSAPTSISPSAT